MALALCAAPLSAQREAAVAANGVISDYRTGAPVTGALIEFPALRRQTTTDHNGRFQLSGLRPGRHKVVVNQIGYKTLVRELQVAEGDLLYIALEPDPVMLRSIEVQVDRLAQRRREVTAAVLTFGRQSLLGSASFSAGEFVRTNVMTVPCAAGRSTCVRRRGQLVQPVIYIDERRAFGLDELNAYPASDLYLVESYDGGRMIRVYTTWFIQNLARNNLVLPQLIIW